jgi:hypothetical protein
MECPGSIREEGKLPEGRPNDERAIDGTHTHTLLEQCVNADLRNALTFVGEKMEDHEGEFTVDVDRAKRVNEALAYIRRRKDELGIVTIRSEEKVNIGQWMKRDDFYGTADVQIVSDGVYEIIDYKDGMFPVPAKDNPQLKLYAVGGIQPYWPEHAVCPFHTIRVTIIQPKLSVKGEDIISYDEFTPGDLTEWVHDTVVPAVLATDAEDAPLKSGDHCKWCGIKGNCAEQANATLTQAQVLFDKVDIAEQAANQNPNELTDDQIREIIEAKPLVMNLIKAVEEEAMRRFKIGQPVSGLKVVKGRGQRKWNQSPEMIEKVLRGMGVPKSAVYEQKLISPAKCGSVTWTKRGSDKEKTLTKRQLDKLNEEYIEKSKGSNTVVPESDSRSAIDLNPTAVFDNVQPDSNTLPNWLTGDIT